MEMFSLLLFVLSNVQASPIAVGSDKKTVAHIALEEMRNVSAECCPNAFECCLESIQFRKPLRCLNESDALTVKEVSDCIQEQMLGKSSIDKISVFDGECCGVFDNDDNDPRGHCRTACNDSVASPSLSSERKMINIKDCQQHNPLYECFRRCQLHIRTPLSARKTAIFVPKNECRNHFWMKPGMQYLGEEVEIFRPAKRD